jgi:hypothetical protein
MPSLQYYTRLVLANVFSFVTFVARPTDRPTGHVVVSFRLDSLHIDCIIASGSEILQQPKVQLTFVIRLKISHNNTKARLINKYNRSWHISNFLACIGSISQRQNGDLEISKEARAVTDEAEQSPS